MDLKIKLLLVSASFLAFLSCNERLEVNEVAEKEKILEIHNQQRENHFQKLLNESFEPFSDQFITVNRGEIKKPSKKEFLAKRKNYFQTVEFEKWDDINPPIIRFSEDYSMAYTVVNKEVVINYLGENGTRQRESTEFSWVTIYKKFESEWKIDCVASTNKPSVISTP